MRNPYKKGSITIYLALTAAVVLSLILTLIEGARISTVRVYEESVVDMGLNSIFAEYHRELLSQYDLFFIDTSYGKKTGSLENTKSHLEEYLSYNFQPNKGFIGNTRKDFLGIQVEQTEIMEAARATDRKGQVVKKQALAYEKDKLGISALEGIFGQKDLLDKNNLENTGQLAASGSIDSQLNNLTREENGKSKKVHLDSPANEVNASKSVGILSLVIADGSKISTRGIQEGAYASHRKKEEGYGIPKGKEPAGTMQEEILFGEYLLEKCGCYTQKKEESLLEYQLEYLLFGKANDRENLTAAANRLLLVRQVANHLYLWSDKGKELEADAAAAAIAASVLMPEIQPLVKASLMFAWAYAESVGDVKILLENGRIPLLKSRSTWRLQFSQLAYFREGLSNQKGTEEGISYREYLRLFLLSANREEKLSRLMNVMEMDIRKTQGNTWFCLDNCIDFILVKIACKSKFGYENTVERTYCYE